MNRSCDASALLPVPSLPSALETLEIEVFSAAI